MVRRRLAAPCRSEPPRGARRRSRAKIRGCRPLTFGRYLLRQSLISTTLSVAICADRTYKPPLRSIQNYPRTVFGCQGRSVDRSPPTPGGWASGDLIVAGARSSRLRMTAVSDFRWLFCRRRGTRGMGGLFSSSQTGQEGADDFGVCDGTDDLHAGAAVGACQHVDGEDAGHQIGPASAGSAPCLWEGGLFRIGFVT